MNRSLSIHPTETGAIVLEHGRENIADFHLRYHATAFLLAVGADRNCVAIFNERADADLFVDFMRPERETA